MDRFRDPKIFQGNLSKKQYFEGWYFKQSSLDGSVVLSIIPGVSLAEKDKHSFVQIFDGKSGKAYYERYNIDEFKPGLEPFSITIGRNVFSLSQVKLEIQEDISVNGSLTFNDLSLFHGDFGMRGVMGWYGYIPFMETYHGLISMDHLVNGSIIINEEKRCFENARGYIEKDWGSSFPSSWIWLQANCFQERSVGIMFSIAVIPWLHSSFVGHLAIFLHHGKFINLSTYAGGKVTRLEKKNNGVSIRVENKKYSIDIWANSDQFVDLKSPMMGVMKGRTAESLQGSIKLIVTNKRDKSTLFSGSSRGLGLEIMDDKNELQSGLF